VKKQPKRLATAGHQIVPRGARNGYEGCFVRPRQGGAGQNAEERCEMATAKGTAGRPVRRRMVCNRPPAHEISDSPGRDAELLRAGARSTEVPVCVQQRGVHRPLGQSVGL